MALMIVAADPDWDSVNWGDFPTWLSAVTTLGALIAAAVVVKIELDRDRERRDELREQRLVSERSDQADRIAAWHQVGHIKVLNSSDLPIWDVHLVATDPATNWEWNEIAAVLPPGASDFDTHIDPDIIDEDDFGRPIYDDWWLSIQVRVTFRDAAGRVWTRHEDGGLELIGRGSSSHSSPGA